MRAVAQRVRGASVVVDGETVGAIEGLGLLVYLGAGEGDTARDVAYTAGKVAGLRIFQDDEGKMSRSVEDVGGGVLVISQFTLYGDVRKGRRPSFSRAAAPELARQLYGGFCEALRERGLEVATGIFAADMLVQANVAGPVTIMIDSQKGF